MRIELFFNRRRPMLTLSGPLGRFILLTYNLGALYSYSLSIRDDDNDDDEGGIDPAIWEIVIHRFFGLSHHA